MLTISLEFTCKKKGKIKNLSKLQKKDKYLHICLYIAFMINYCLDLISSKNNITIDDDDSKSSYSSCTSGDEGLKCTIHSFMEVINTELDFQGRQINKILDDIQQSHEVVKG